MKSNNNDPTVVRKTVTDTEILPNSGQKKIGMFHQSSSGDTGIDFTLVPGEYLIEVEAPAYGVGPHRSKIYDITNTADIKIGPNGYSSSTSATLSMATVKANVTITSATTYEVRHRCGITASVSGFGPAANFGEEEVFTAVKITQLRAL